MKSIKIDVYNAEIKLFKSNKEMKSFLSKNCSEETHQYLSSMSDGSDGMGGYFYTEEDEGFYFITLEDSDLVTLCHESLHVAYMILAAVGVEHTVDNHEALAYLLHTIFQKAGKAYGLLS
jgi:hypothetical protein